MTQQPLSDQGSVVMEPRLSYSDTLPSVGHLWTSDRSVAKTSTWQHTKLTTERYPCLRWASNPQS